MRAVTRIEDEEEAMSCYRFTDEDNQDMKTKQFHETFVILINIHNDLRTDEHLHKAPLVGRIKSPNIYSSHSCDGKRRFSPSRAEFAEAIHNADIPHV